MVSIYILLLEDNKYYVGKSPNPKFRIEQHFNSNGSSWTKKYKPIRVIETINNCDNFDEDKYTLKYMAKFGINNVRGGSFCEITLSDNNILTLEKMLKSSQDKCYICNNFGHFAKNCKQNENKIFTTIESLATEIGNFANNIIYYTNYTINYFSNSQKETEK